MKGDDQDSLRFLQGLSVVPLLSRLEEGDRASEAAWAMSPGTSKLGGGGSAAGTPPQELAGARGEGRGSRWQAQEGVNTQKEPASLRLKGCVSGLGEEDWGLRFGLG